MESEKNSDKYDLYERLRNFALYCAEFKDYKRAQQILSVMVKNWPERVIAKGEVASDLDIPDSKLGTTAPTP
jgi:hypothetical protein